MARRSRLVGAAVRQRLRATSRRPADRRRPRSGGGEHRAVAAAVRCRGRAGGAAIAAGVAPGGSGTSVPPDAARRVDDHGEVDRDAEVAAERVADRVGAGCARWRPWRTRSARPAARCRRSGRAGGSAGGTRAAGRTGSARRNSADAPDRSAMTRFQTCPRSPGWSATGRHPLRFVALDAPLLAAAAADDHPQTCPHLCARPYAGTPRWARAGPCGAEVCGAIPPDRTVRGHANNTSGWPQGTRRAQGGNGMTVRSGRFDPLSDGAAYPGR